MLHCGVFIVANLVLHRCIFPSSVTSPIKYPLHTPVLYSINLLIAVRLSLVEHLSDATSSSKLRNNICQFNGLDWSILVKRLELKIYTTIKSCVYLQNNICGYFSKNFNISRDDCWGICCTVSFQETCIKFVSCCDIRCIRLCCFRGTFQCLDCGVVEQLLLLSFCCCWTCFVAEVGLVAAKNMAGNLLQLLRNIFLNVHVFWCYPDAKLMHFVVR